MSSGVKTREDWRALAAQMRPSGLAVIDGESRNAQSGQTFLSTNPATMSPLADVAECGPDDVELAVQAARRAFEVGVWSSCAPVERKRILLRLAELISAHADELALLESLDMGKLVSAASAADVPSAANIVAWYAEAVDKMYDEIAPTGPGHLALVTREPLGVVGAVVPWNFPLDMAVWKSAPALAAGNSVVLKPAEQSPLSAIRLAELALEAGVPPGVFNVVPGFGESAGKALGLHPDVDCLAFTGSTAVGKYFMEYSARSNMKQVWLECGGKSPNLVFADVSDIDDAASKACAGILYNQGEVCSANSRLLIQRDIHEDFVECLLGHVASIVPGDPLDPAAKMGAMVSEEHTTRVMEYIEVGKGEGRLLAGGERTTVDGAGYFVMPTVFDDVHQRDRIAQEEIFGPVLAILPFTDEQDAISMANDSIYGLAASVWTGSIDRAHRVARRLRAGTVSVNAVDALNVATPFGGFKQSGTGRDLSLHALDKYTGLKTTWISYKEA